MTAATWTVRTTTTARRDFARIVEESERLFGIAQARRYGALLVDALVDLRGGPRVLGSFARDDVGFDYRIFPISRRGRRGRHVLVYHATGPADIEVLRILHERMDLARHLPPSPN